MKQTLSQKSWEWIKTQQKFCSKDLASEMDVSLEKAQNAIYHLMKLGALKSKRQASKGVMYFPKKNANPHLPGKNSTSPQPGSVRQRMWQAMRFLRKFTVDEVTATAECSRSSAEKFISDLRKYNYVAITRRINVASPMSSRRGRSNHYMLVRNTGRLYPVFGPRGMRDQNLNEYIRPADNKSVAKR